MNREFWEAGVRHVIPIHLSRNAFGHPAVFNPTLNAMNYAATGQCYVTGDAFDAGVRFDPTRASGGGIAGLVLRVSSTGRPRFLPRGRSPQLRDSAMRASRSSRR